MNSSQRVQLYIALEIKRICEKNDIRYFIMAGTLLGAVRHGGFIPWDDDMDIGMERNEYERFITVCKTDLGSEFFLQTWDTDPHYANPYGKIMLKDTSWIEEGSRHVDIQHGVYVDVFPFDAIPNDGKKRGKQILYSQVYRQLLLAANKYDSYLFKKGIKKLIFIGLRAIGPIIPISLIKKRYKKLIESGHEYNSKDYFAFGIPYSYERGVMKKEWIENLYPIEFEGLPFLAPLDYDSNLKCLYGDYMTPPPEDKRANYHSIVSSDLGNYENVILK